MDNVPDNVKAEICKCGHRKDAHAGPIYAGYCLERMPGLYSDDEVMECPCPRYTWDSHNDLNLRRLGAKR